MMSDFMNQIFNNFPYLLGKYFPYLVGPFRDVPALLLLPSTAIALSFLSPVRFSSRWLTYIAVALASAIVLVMAWSSCAYLTQANYFDHVEPSIAAVSWWYHTGHPLYPAWREGEGLYGFTYGPLLFQITAAALALGPTILLSKLP